MEIKKIIILKHKKNLELIKKYNKSYYILDKPIINDDDYDKLKISALKFEKKYPFLKNYESVNDIVGSKPLNKFKKIKHLSPMLSLNNAFDINDMKDFIKKINNFLSLKGQNIELYCEPKIDGISATLIYEDGILTRGLSRGDGIIGEDILENLKTINDLPKKIKAKNVPDLLEVRCEIYIGKKILKKFQKDLLTQEMQLGDLLDKKTQKKLQKYHLNILHTDLVKFPK